MLSSLFPNTCTRYTALPLLGGVLEGLCWWLESRGYPQDAICRRIEAAPFLDAYLRQQQIESLCGCTVDRLLACLPREKRWTPQIAYSLGQSLAAYLKERGIFAFRPIMRSDQLVDAYRKYLASVRGFAGGTIVRHAEVAKDFLRFLRYDDTDHRQVTFDNVDTFVVQASTHVGRITMQKVIAIMRSFLRFLETCGEAPVGLDRHLESPRHHRDERLVRALPWDDVLSLLRGIDRSTTKGCRDYAMLLLIATYGLRRSEVTSLHR